MERGTLIENKDKLKVVVVPQMISPHQSTDSSIAGDCGTSNVPEGSESYSSTPSGSSKLPPRVIADDDSHFDSFKLSRKGRVPVISDESASRLTMIIDPKDSVSEFHTVKPKKRKVLKNSDDAVPHPSPYRLPCHYPSDVEVALKQGRLYVLSQGKLFYPV